MSLPLHKTPTVMSKVFVRVGVECLPVSVAKKQPNCGEHHLGKKHMSYARSTESFWELKTGSPPCSSIMCNRGFFLPL